MLQPRSSRDGRLLSIPAAHGKRLIVLDWLAQEFEPGRRYSEPMVNLILGRWHAGHRGAAPLPGRRGLPRPGRRRVLAQRRGRPRLTPQRHPPRAVPGLRSAHQHVVRPPRRRARGAAPDEIRAAYRRIARRVHPDRGSAGNEAAMAAVNEAWRVLSDPGRRAEYDASLRARASTVAAAPSAAPARARRGRRGRARPRRPRPSPVLGRRPARAAGAGRARRDLPLHGLRPRRPAAAPARPCPAPRSTA